MNGRVNAATQINHATDNNETPVVSTQFKGVKYLPSVIDSTVFNKLTENLPDISEQQIKHAEDELKTWQTK